MVIKTSQWKFDEDCDIDIVFEELPIEHILISKGKNSTL